MFAAQNEPVQIAALPLDVETLVLTPEATRFLVKLSTSFEPRRRKLLDARCARQAATDAGVLPDFSAETVEIRTSDWTIAGAPADLQDRRVEITGPTNRKMVINALNSGARVFMADFEDSNSPTWKNMLEGQQNLRDAVNGTITYDSPEGKHYELREDPAVLMVRPRGWHLVEKHFLVNGEPISAALFDFGLFFFHNVRTLIHNGTGPYFYLPKLESCEEARLWNDVFVMAQDYVGVSRGTIRATVLIETIRAAFEMDEILWQLRDHAAGLNCGRWDYIFSYIKTFRRRADCVLPDRSQVSMTRHFLASYADLLVATCHRRGAHAMGGMAAQIPIQNDPSANAAAMEAVRKDKLREVWAGHDGTWVAHPGLVPVAERVFDTYMPFPNQLDRFRSSAAKASDLLAPSDGTITEAGLAINVDVGLQYLTAWLGGNGCVPIYNLMEDAATAEISRAQLWQWICHGAKLEDGRVISPSLVRKQVERQVSRLRNLLPEKQLAVAVHLFDEILNSLECADFLTIRAYDYLD